MKQLVFMIVATLYGTAGVYLVSPFYGVFVYYLFAVLRPQYMWEWSLPTGVNWSLYVALATIGAALFGGPSVRTPEQQRSESANGQQRLSRAHLAILTFGCWILVTCLTARNFSVAWFWFIEYLKIFLMFIVATKFITTVPQIWALFVMIGSTLGYISYEINYLYFVNNYLGIVRNGYGGLDNNGAGLMLAMGVPICWFSYEGMPSGLGWRLWVLRFAKYGSLALIPVIVHAVLMTYSRGAMLSLIVVCPWMWWRSRQKCRLTITLAAFVLVVIPMMAGAEISARFLTLEQTDTDDSATSRKDSWMAAWRMAKDYPIFGVGVRNANLFSHQYGADVEGRTIHSQYLQILADNGFVGLALYLVALGATFVTLTRTRKLAIAKADNTESRMVIAAAAGIQCSLVLFCFGAVFLSLEVFELPYLLLLLAAQLPLVTGAREAAVSRHIPDRAFIARATTF